MKKLINILKNHTSIEEDKSYLVQKKILLQKREDNQKELKLKMLKIDNKISRRKLIK